MDEPQIEEPIEAPIEPQIDFVPLDDPAPPQIVENTPQYIDIPAGDDVLRVVYEMTVGDMIVAATGVMLLVYLIVTGAMRVLWR